MKMPVSFLKIIIVLAFVSAVPIMMIGANFFILKSQHLLHNCVFIRNYLALPLLPCHEIAMPALEPLINILGFLIMLTTAYGLYLINDRFRNKI